MTIEHLPEASAALFLMVEKQGTGLKLRDHVWVPKVNKAQNNSVELFCDLWAKVSLYFCHKVCSAVYSNKNR